MEKLFPQRNPEKVEYINNRKDWRPIRDVKQNKTVETEGVMQTEAQDWIYGFLLQTVTEDLVSRQSLDQSGHKTLSTLQSTWGPIYKISYDNLKIMRKLR